MRSVGLVQTDDRNTNQLQQNIMQALRPILQNPLVNGYILSGIVLASGDNTIFHKLSRDIQGYIPILKSAAVDIYDKQSSNDNKSTTLILNSSGAATISIYVF
jgi:hypothetical protein